MEFYKILTSIMEEKNLSIPQVAKMTGLSDSTVRSIITRKQNSVALEVAAKISKGLNVTYERLNGETEHHTFSSEEINYIKKYRTLDVYGKNVIDTILDIEFDRCNPQIKLITRPFYSIPVSAGFGNPLDDSPEEELEIEDTPEHRKGDFIVKISGDSMKPYFDNDDLVLVQKQPTIEIGEIGIFVLNGESYIKKLGVNELISLNTKYPPKPYNATDSIICCGKVICKIKNSQYR